VLRCVASIALFACCVTWSATEAASPPSERLFPNTTKGWISIPNVDLLRDNFKLTQLGKLVDDPAMKPFMEDLGGQLEDKLNEAGVRLGIKFSDLDGVYGGEVATGLLKPDPKDKNSHALALVVDITGRHKPAADLLAKIHKNLTAKGATSVQRVLGGTKIIVYTLPKKDKAAYAIIGDTLIASDNEAVLVGILGRIDGKAGDALGSAAAFSHIAEKVHGERDPLESQLRWFVEPLGYAEAARAANGGKVKRGLDKLRVIREQGFGAIQGIGGRIDLHAGDHEIQHESYAYAPAVPGAKKGEKYLKAANILDFPNGKNLEVQEWVPASISTYLTFNWDVQKGFKHFGSLFDAFADDPGTWDEVLEGLKNDPAGPEIDVEKELVALLDTRLTAVVDYVEPITPTSERVLIAMELNSKIAGVEKKAIEGIRKLMKVEAEAHPVKIEGFDAWEVRERTEETDIPVLDIEGDGFVALEGKAVEEKDGEAVPVAVIAPAKKVNWAVTVAHGHIFIGTHVELIAEAVKDKAEKDQLRAAADLARVRKSLVKLGSGVDSWRFFSRTDEAFHPTFELLKQGRMPEAETLLGRLLNQAFAPNRKGELRKQEIDGGKLPAWTKVRDYFGPAGTFAQTEDEGWLIRGVLLKKELAEGTLKKPEEVAGGKEKDME
jgi:hypothetical protein